MYNQSMLITQTNLQKLAEKLWAEYAETFPRLVKFDCPKIIINNRFTSTGGVNDSYDNRVELAGKFFANNKKAMLEVTLPHELAHQIDFNLNGWYNRRKHHNSKWCEIMVLIGQIPDPYHYMKL